MKRLYLVLLLLLLAALACTAPPPTETAEPTPTEDVTETPITETPTATETPVPPTTIPPTPTATEIAPSPTVTLPPEEWTPTPIVPGPSEPPNLLTNGGFEPPYIQQANYDNHFVAHGWDEYSCEYPWLPENSDEFCGGHVSLPEWKEMKFSDYPYRVFAGESAQNWFSFYRRGRGGVFQIVNTPVGYDCRAQVYVQSWSSPEDAGSTSRLITQDDRDNHHWRIKISLDGNAFPFHDQQLVSRDFGFSDGIYDNWALIWFDFRSNSSRTGYFIESDNKWAIQHNDFHADNASMQCWPVGERPGPPAPPPAEHPTAHYAVTVNVRGGPGTSYDTLAVVKAGETVSVLDIVEKNNEAQSVWIKIFDTPQTGPGWAALRYAGQCYAVVDDTTLPCASSGPTGYTAAPLVIGDNPLPWQAAGIWQDTSGVPVTVFCDGCPPESISVLPPGVVVPFGYRVGEEFYVLVRHWRTCGYRVWSAATLTHNPNNATFDADALLHLWGQAWRTMTLPPPDETVKCED